MKHISAAAAGGAQKKARGKDGGGLRGGPQSNTLVGRTRGGAQVVQEQRVVQAPPTVDCGGVRSVSDMVGVFVGCDMVRVAAMFDLIKSIWRSCDCSGAQKYVRKFACCRLFTLSYPTHFCISQALSPLSRPSSAAASPALCHPKGPPAAGNGGKGSAPRKVRRPRGQ
jgi:hypothetical protein